MLVSSPTAAQHRMEDLGAIARAHGDELRSLLAEADAAQFGAACKRLGCATVGQRAKLRLILQATKPAATPAVEVAATPAVEAAVGAAVAAAAVGPANKMATTKPSSSLEALTNSISSDEEEVVKVTACACTFCSDE